MAALARSTAKQTFVDPGLLTLATPKRTLTSREIQADRVKTRGRNDLAEYFSAAARIPVLNSVNVRCLFSARPLKDQRHAPCSPPGRRWPEQEKVMGHSEYDPAVKERRQWNAGRMVGAKRALKPQQVWAIRFWLDRERRLRDRAMFDLAIDSKLRGCDVVKVKIGDLVIGGHVRSRAIVIQQKTARAGGNRHSRPIVIAT
jgi:hypothetical protein